MHGVIEKLARFMALVGGAVLTALIVLTCLSVLGRSLNGMLHSDLLQSTMPALADGLLAIGIGPINGDFELVEAGMAFAIFAFLPICQWHNAHASVDIFASKMPLGMRRVLRWLTELVFAAVLVLIAVQLFAGMQSKLRSGQTTFLLEFPLWWAYALSLLGAGVAAIVALYVSALRCAEIVTGRSFLPASLEADQ